MLPLRLRSNKLRIYVVKSFVSCVCALWLLAQNKTNCWESPFIPYFICICVYCLEYIMRALFVIVWSETRAKSTSINHTYCNVLLIRNIIKCIPYLFIFSFHFRFFDYPARKNKTKHTTKILGRLHLQSIPLFLHNMFKVHHPIFQKWNESHCSSNSWIDNETEKTEYERDKILDILWCNISYISSF